MPHINWSNFGGMFNYMNYGGAITAFRRIPNELLLCACGVDDDDDKMVYHHQCGEVYYREILTNRGLIRAK